MTVRITGGHMSGDRTGHTARLIPGSQDAWEVSWLPGRLMTRNAAISAMLLASIAGSRAPQAGDRLPPHIQSWAAEVGLTAPDALARVAQPAGGTSAERDGDAQADLEAGS